MDMVWNLLERPGQKCGVKDLAWQEGALPLPSCCTGGPRAEPPGCKGSVRLRGAARVRGGAEALEHLAEVLEMDQGNSEREARADGALGL